MRRDSELVQSVYIVEKRSFFLRGIKREYGGFYLVEGNGIGW